MGGAFEQIRCRHNFVDESNAVSLLCADQLCRKDELQCTTLSHQTRQSLRAAATRDESEGDFRLAELRCLHRDPDRASHRRLAATAESKAVDRRYYGLAKVLDEIEDLQIILASRSCTNWNDPIGLPNCSRFWLYSSAVS